MKLNLGDLIIRSPAFGNLEYIPKKYASDGENISPPLEWTNIPENTKQLALLIFDPDAPYPKGFTHWVVYGISPQISSIKEGEKNKNFTEGTNSGGQIGYAGPAPPPGNGPHHYYFWLYALNKKLDLKPGLTHEQLIDAISDHITVQSRLVGIYENK